MFGLKVLIIFYPGVEYHTKIDLTIKTHTHTLWNNWNKCNNLVQKLGSSKIIRNGAIPYPVRTWVTT